MERVLKIYRASAGSGKTFTLALEYMKLLVENPYSYRNILAVTFTNKATGEMKERILSKLYGVANRLESSKEYFEKMVKQLPHLSSETIIKNAGKALELILHDYGHFRIQTIDAFFQTVLRSLAKELELNGDMEISLDGDALLEDAVYSYIRNLDPEPKQIAPILNFIEDKLSAGNDWHVSNDLKDFAKNILKEEYQQRGEALRTEMEANNGVLLKEFYEKVNQKLNSIIGKAKNIGNQFFNIANNYRPNDFYDNKKGEETRGLWGFFLKLQAGNTPVVSEKYKNLLNDRQKISAVCPDVDKIADLIKESLTLNRERNNCELSLKHYHQLGMLNSIAKTLKSENEKENRFLLAETTYLLSSMIGKNTTFIFEKIGTEIDHIFIDEFQDTSKLQWNCFKVLLEEVLARGNFNLIVGDVKQSIYRWRNSDWNIMNNIGSEFRSDLITFADQSTSVEGKKLYSTNYRSDSNIVTFNNALYRIATNFISTNYEKALGKNKLSELLTAYEDVEQALPTLKNPDCGYSEVRIIDKTEEESKFKKNAIRQLMETLHRLIDKENVAPADIAILLRYKESMKDIVDAFNTEFPDIRIVSDEAYRLESSLTLQLVISAMRYISSPEDRINIANLVKLYAKVVERRNETFNDCISNNKISSLLPDEFIKKIDYFQSLPIYELIEQLLQLFGMSEEKDEEAYIYAFLDNATQYLTSRTSDLNGFLEAWDNEICQKSIPAEDVNSIRLMTIHKSKGLEFHTVILPLCDWKLTGDSRNSLWCEPKEAPYDTLSLLSVPLNKDMLESIYCEDYNKEQLYQIVDNLNILYVATTRAKSNLFIFSDGTGGRGDTVSKLLNGITKNLTILKGSKFENEVFEYGSIVPSEVKEKEDKKKEEKKKNENPFEVKAKSIRQPFVYHHNRITFRQSNELTRFLATDKEEKTQLKNIAEGKLLHLVMSGINKANDIEKVLDKLMIEGLIASEKQYNRIKELITRAISHSQAKEWFTGKYQLYNECSILISNKDETIKRPDRVMIKDNEAVVVDYKFAKENDEYRKQVEDYMKLLVQMGYENVKGYLWYVYNNKIEEVKIYDTIS